MRPSILFPLFAEIRTLSGVGPKLEKLIAKVAGPRLVDLIFDLPVGVIDRSYRPKLIAAEPGRIATVEVGVLDHLPPRVKSQPYKVRVSDDTRGDGTGVLPRRRQISERRFCRRDRGGIVSRPDRKLQGPAADGPSRLCGGAGRGRALPQHEPVYALTEGLPAKSLAKAVRGALEQVPAMPEWQDAAFLQARRLCAVSTRR